MTLKGKVKKLESELDEAKRKAANLILNTEDNVFTKDELKKIKLLLRKITKKKLSKKKAFPPTLLLTLTTIQNKY